MGEEYIKHPGNYSEELIEEFELDRRRTRRRRHKKRAKRYRTWLCPDWNGQPRDAGSGDAATSTENENAEHRLCMKSFGFYGVGGAVEGDMALEVGIGIRSARISMICMAQ